MPERKVGHQPVEHTADLAIRAWAPDLAGLIEQAAAGMLELMLERRPEPDEYVEVVGEGRDAEDLLVDCLREILALWTVERRLPVAASVTAVAYRRATCRVGVAQGAPEQEIKAVTYHGIEIERVEGRLEVMVVFDV